MRILPSQLLHLGSIPKKVSSMHHPPTVSEVIPANLELALAGLPIQMKRLTQVTGVYVLAHHGSRRKH